MKKKVLSAAVLSLSLCYLAGAEGFNAQMPQLSTPSNGFYSANSNSGYYYRNGYSQMQNRPVNSYSRYNQYQSNYNLPPLQGYVLKVPEGSSFLAYAATPISSENLFVGDTVSVSLPSGFFYNGAMVAPAGSMVQGNVVIAKKAGRAGIPGQLRIKFTNIMTPDGQSIPISGKIRTQDGSGVLVGATAKDRALDATKNTAVGAASGALFGTVIGAITGKTGKGAWSGTAVGAGLGLGKSVVDKGAEAIIEAGKSLEIELDQPMTVTPQRGY